MVRSGKKLQIIQLKAQCGQSIETTTENPVGIPKNADRMGIRQPVDETRLITTSIGIRS